MEQENTQTTLRDTLSDAFDEHIQPKEDSKPVEKAPEQAAEASVEEVKQGRTAGRPRDEKGRLLPGGKAEKPQEAQAEAPKPERKPIRIRDRDIEYWNKPSTWKKELEEHWGKLPEAVMQEIHRRESDAAFGVSTYKAEYDQYKPIAEVFKAYQPFLQQHNISPDNYAKALVQTDQIMRFGTPQQKLQHFAQLSQLYQIPLHELFVQGEDGKVYFNQQHLSSPQQASQQQAISREDIKKMLDEERSNAYWAAQIQSMKEAKDGDGNPRYPHFEALRQSMHGLLQSGLAKDLPTAYEGSLRLPQHADLFEAQQTAQRTAEEKAKMQAKSEQADRARRNAVSVKGQAPTGEIQKQTGRKGLRDVISDAFDAVESRRV